MLSSRWEGVPSEHPSKLLRWSACRLYTRNRAPLKLAMVSVTEIRLLAVKRAGFHGMGLVMT